MPGVPGNKNGGSLGIRGRWLVVTALVTVLVCSAISWVLISNVTVAKSEYTPDITKIRNDVGHVQDAVTGLDSYTNYQDNNVQNKFDDVDGQITDLNNGLLSNATADNQTRADLSATKDSLNTVKTRTDSLDTKVGGLDTAINDSTSGLKTQVNNLNTTVAGISGLQIIPSIATSSGAGTITLAINSNQTVTTQLIAFDVEFRPTSDVISANTTDLLMTALYSTPPVTLNPGGSSSAAVAADHTAYNLYWASGSCHLGSITFKTYGTSIVKGSQTKTLAYTYTGSAVYEIIINAEYEPTTNTDPAGALAITW